MARLIYAAITSLDGYMGDRDSNFDWAVPTAEVFAAVLELERPIGTYLYGRGMYETTVSDRCANCATTACTCATGCGCSTARSAGCGYFAVTDPAGP
jgi:hypothetical protein